jgi:hypothetical protein
MIKEIDMGNCKDCHWWKKGHMTVLEPGVPDEIFTSSDGLIDENTGMCSLTRWQGFHKKWDYPKSLAVAIDKDHWYAIMLTSPDYGCVQFEAAKGWA